MCGGDDEEFKRVFVRKSACERFIDKIKGLVFTCINVYVIFSLILTLREMQREELRLSETPPSDRCLPFFDNVLEFVRQNSNNTKALYDWHPTKGAILRICSGQNQSVVEAALGVSKSYDPWKVDGNCDVRGSTTNTNNFLSNCEMVGFHSHATCADALSFPPTGVGSGVGGVHYNGWVTDLTGNRTFPNGTSIPRGPCSVQVNHDSSLPNCTESYVGAFKEANEVTTIIMWCAVFVPWIVMALQTYACKQYADGGWTSEDGPKLAFAARGIPGGFYLLHWSCNEGAEQDRGEYPDVYLSWYGFFFCALQDAFEGLAAPITAVLGCSVARYPVPLVLIIVKGGKICFDFVNTLVNRNETAEPGKKSAQDELERDEDRKEAEWKAKKEGKVYQAPPEDPAKTPAMSPAQGGAMQPNPTHTVMVGQPQPQQGMMMQQQQPQPGMQPQPVFGNQAVTPQPVFAQATPTAGQSPSNQV